MKAVAEPPDVRAAVDGETQIDAVAIGDPLPRIFRADGLEGHVRSYEVLATGATFSAPRRNFLNPR
ncbi:MAG: hypothetical protein M3Z54_00855 [Gemmatimonadota bacterium]|nr:hypothetical protein [Gemmatimonadota bacterium]